MCTCSCGRKLICKCPDCGKIHGDYEHYKDRICQVEMDLSEMIRNGMTIQDAIQKVRKDKKSGAEI